MKLVPEHACSVRILARRGGTDYPNSTPVRVRRLNLERKEVNLQGGGAWVFRSSRNSTRSSSFFENKVRTKALIVLSSEVEGFALIDVTSGGDVPGDLCKECVQHATQTLSAECSLSKAAVMWIDECMVRYSNRSFFSIVDTRPRLFLYSERNVSDQESFMRLVFGNLNKTADEAAGGNREKMYATSQTDITENRTLYSLAQCTPDLSPNDCRRCLGVAIGELPQCCQGNDGGIVLYPSCNVRYSLYPYYRPPMPTSARVPASNLLVSDSSYVYHNCTTNTTADSTYKIHLKTLLFYLSSNATNGNKLYKGVENTVYGLFTCRGDLHSRPCEQRVLDATQRISSECSSFQEAIIWYSDCMLRYSYRDFSFQVEETPNFQMFTTISNPVPGQETFPFMLSSTLLDLADVASNSEERYATKSSKFNDLQTLYTLAQCTLVRIVIAVWRIYMKKLNPMVTFGKHRGNCSISELQSQINSIMFQKIYEKLEMIFNALTLDRKGWIQRRMQLKQQPITFRMIIRSERVDSEKFTSGYMSPEYAMYGQFSEKSDVFSFGVMVLEIISGKKNLSYCQPHSVVDGLLSYGGCGQWLHSTPMRSLYTLKLLINPSSFNALTLGTVMSQKSRVT
ncbi:hypothetical protein Fmac_015736 [Flemingia macrophylla]|uniref:Gnk2-homologous domain-containing protein n=1 Tax=Flemingia macrophylla TaxID=520843 RepID=A0ABD1MFE5_9FABA